MGGGNVIKKQDDIFNKPVISFDGLVGEHSIIHPVTTLNFGNYNKDDFLLWRDLPARRGEVAETQIHHKESYSFS